MKPIYIQGVGVISRCALNFEDLLKIADDEPFSINFDKKLTFPPNAPSSKIRRAPRYTRMAVSAATQAKIDANLSDDQDKTRVGTIFSSGFGSLESTLEFSDSILPGKPDLVSPILFSYSVANACVGQICILNGFTGFSTLLTAGDPLEYSSILLSTDKADVIFCGATDEYTEELDTAIKSCGILQEKISDGAAVLILSANAEKSYCRVKKFSSSSLSAYPYIHEVDKNESATVLSEIFSIYEEPEVILTSCNGSYFDEVEKSVLKEKFKTARLIDAKKYFGETLGGGYILNVALGAAFIEIGRCKSLLATGIDVHGNYLTAFLD